jgi:hypothetical protein
MAVLLKEADPVDHEPTNPPTLKPLVPPFDVVTYAGPITIEGYERLSALLRERRSNDKVLLVLETPGGDPHAAFRIARALGFHYERVEAFVPRYCKSAGTLIVLGASVLHMDDLAELGPLDMQVPRVNEAARHGSALEFGGALDLLWTRQLLSHAESMREIVGQGLSPDGAAMAATSLVGSAFQPILKQINPMKLAAMSRAMTIAIAYGERLAAKGGNIASTSVWDLVYGYPSHAFVIDRKEAQRLFLDVRAPLGAVAEMAQWCRVNMPGRAESTTPLVNVHPFSMLNLEALHAQ